MRLYKILCVDTGDKNSLFERCIVEIHLGDHNSKQYCIERESYKDGAMPVGDLSRGIDY